MYFKPKDAQQAATPQQTNDEIAQPKEAHIYFDYEGTLLAVKPDTKEVTTIDTGIDGNSGHAEYGSTTPLTSPDLHSVAYVKDNAAWIATGEEKAKFFTPAVTGDAVSLYTTYLSAWSSDSSKLAIAVGFMCPVVDVPSSVVCKEDSVDKDAIGVYVYDVATKKTTKLSTSSVIQWLPGTTQLLSFDDTTTPKTLSSTDVNSNKTSVISSQQFGFAPQSSFSFDGKKALYAIGVGGTQSSEIFISNIDGSQRQSLKTGAFAELQWPQFLPNSDSDYIYSKQQKIACYGGGTGCVNFSLQLVKNGEEKQLIESASDKVIGYYNGSAVVVSGDGQNGLNPNNPAPYKTQLKLINLDSLEATTLYEKSTPKSNDADGRLYLRIGR